MTVIAVPDLEEEPWPTLGPQVCAWIETNLVFGPGDLQGSPAKVDIEKRGLIYRMYEVYPEGAKDLNGKSIAGRRRFRRVALSLQKGSAKTELAAWIAAVELAPDGPVRCDGFRYGQPIGRPVVSPYIPLVAYTEEQSEDLAYGVLKDILERSPISTAFDIGFERITRAGNPSAKCQALAGAPDSRDGALTTFAHKDETHRWTLPRLKRAHRTMLANLPKRLLADPWELETTTSYSPGAGSVAEETFEYARSILEGKLKDARLFFFHRQAGDGFDLSDRAQLREAVIEAAGPTAPWRDIDGIVDQWQDPKADFAYLERVYLNRPVMTSAKAFDAGKWRELTIEGFTVEPGTLITLGFDGAPHHDWTDLVGTEVETGYQWLVGHWAKPEGADDWEVPYDEIDAVLIEAFDTFDVWRLYADPYWFESYVAQWIGRWGDERVIAWRTNRVRQMAYACKAYANAINEGQLGHEDNPILAQGIGNACRKDESFVDEDGRPLWTIRKDRPGSPFKIDPAMAAILSWEARTDAVADGKLEPAEEASFFFARGDRTTTRRRFDPITGAEIEPIEEEVRRAIFGDEEQE